MADPQFKPFPFDDEAPAPKPGGIAARARATTIAPYLDGLNAEQLEAVESLDGPVLVLAGAGTGKTRVLTTRIAHLLATGKARPSGILAVTFTNKAAREMKERVSHMVGDVVEGMPWMGTFHSIGAKILRRHAELVGLNPSFTILDTDDQIRLIKQLLQADNIDEKRWPARLFAGYLDGWKNRGLGPEQVPAGEAMSFANGKGKELYAAYQARLKVLNAVDFGDAANQKMDIAKPTKEVAYPTLHAGVRPASVPPAGVRAYVEAAQKAGDAATYLPLPAAGHFEPAVPHPASEAALKQALQILLKAP